MIPQLLVSGALSGQSLKEDMWRARSLCPVPLFFAFISLADTLPKLTPLIPSPKPAFPRPSPKPKPTLIQNNYQNVSQLITSSGYTVREYNVTTRDSYILMIQRIPRGRNEPRGKRRRKPVAFLMTGLLSSSADYVVNLPDQSLGFILADNGFDVWLGNVRGTIYSSHEYLKKWQARYWDFSFDEMINFDLPDQIDFILKKTRQSSLLYVGWSQGSLIMFGLLASKPSYNKKVRLFNAIAPVAYLGHMTSEVSEMVPFADFLNGLLQMTLHGAFLEPSGPVFEQIKEEECGSSKQGPACKAAFKLFNGGFPVEMNKTRFPVYMYNNPAGSSVRNMYHFAQIIRDNRCQMFDWGPLKNMKIYGQKRPPAYDLTKVTAPVALYWSAGDVLARPTDVRHLEKSLPNLVLSYKVPVRGFTHIDFVWSIKAKNHLYRMILYMMQRYSQEQPQQLPSPSVNRNTVHV
uniref:Lysosomal acid lipase/cholesteryl ester hydrolase n=1 Tax=Rhipicephalus appendiculatus TaxID=34631 RepID=A0A131YN79_RHIAP